MTAGLENDIHEHDNTMNGREPEKKYKQDDVISPATKGVGLDRGELRHPFFLLSSLSVVLGVRVVYNYIYAVVREVSADQEHQRVIIERMMPEDKPLPIATVGKNTATRVMLP